MERQATHDGEGSGDLPEAEIRAEIERIVNSRAFAGSDRLCRFLTWVVERTLRGEAENIKQYVIGREVFDEDGLAGDGEIG